MNSKTTALFSSPLSAKTGTKAREVRLSINPKRRLGRANKNKFFFVLRSPCTTFACENGIEPNSIHSYIIYKQK